MFKFHLSVNLNNNKLPAVIILFRSKSIYDQKPQMSSLDFLTSNIFQLNNKVDSL